MVEGNPWNPVAQGKSSSQQERNQGFGRGNPWNLQDAYRENCKGHSDGSSDSSLKEAGREICVLSNTLNFLISSSTSFIREEGIPTVKSTSKWPSSCVQSCARQNFAIPRWGPPHASSDRWKNLCQNPPALVFWRRPFLTTRTHSSKAGW